MVVVIVFVDGVLVHVVEGMNKECKMSAAEAVISKGWHQFETKASVYITTAGRTAVV